MHACVSRLRTWSNINYYYLPGCELACSAQSQYRSNTLVTSFHKRNRRLNLAQALLHKLSAKSAGDSTRSEHRSPQKMRSGQTTHFENSAIFENVSAKRPRGCTFGPLLPPGWFRAARTPAATYDCALPDHQLPHHYQPFLTLGCQIGTNTQ